MPCASLASVNAGMPPCFSVATRSSAFLVDRVDTEMHVEAAVRGAARGVVGDLRCFGLAGAGAVSVFGGVAAGIVAGAVVHGLGRLRNLGGPRRRLDGRERRVRHGLGARLRILRRIGRRIDRQYAVLELAIGRGRNREVDRLGGLLRCRDPKGTSARR